ncbi:MAG: 16S rRNA (cytosine(1402)-N(4))-methyltransferase RsmH [Thermodesulfovibrionia bacterium]|nr:16S rRNA (cytosine(1402)-N(4))-methyltransferase RsmH [Thermodesulfovibrionia bacterium]
MAITHVPVMPGEVLEGLNIKDSGIYVDATLGLGGHAELILQKAKVGALIGIDRDEAAIESARERLKDFSNIYFAKESFSNIKAAVSSLGYETVDGILLDIGVSTMQLKAEGRGFSFMKDEPLDMRMDKSQKLSAKEVVNSYHEKDLATLIFVFGEERFSRKIAKAIVNERRKKRIETCSELAAIIENSLKGRGRIHPATRTFQALRIEVNKELDELSAGITSGADMLNPGGRLCVLSYHSLEDRIVKNAFKKLASEGIFHIITRKPLVASRQEIRSNPPSRSAKLRVAERI